MNEQRMNGHAVEEQALKVTHEDQSRGRGRGRQSFHKSTIECYHCHELGHFQYECPKKEKQTRTNYVETNEEILLMAYVEV